MAPFFFALKQAFDSMWPAWYYSRMYREHMRMLVGLDPRWYTGPFTSLVLLCHSLSIGLISSVFSDSSVSPMFTVIIVTQP